LGVFDAAVCDLCVDLGNHREWEVLQAAYLATMGRATLCHQQSISFV